MKLIKLKCEDCGATLDANKDLEKIICNYCGNEILIDDEATKIKRVEKAKLESRKLNHEQDMKEKKDKQELMMQWNEKTIKNLIIIFGLIFIITIPMVVLITIIVPKTSESPEASNQITETNNTDKYTIDYQNEKDFEKAINNGKKVINKIVKFAVKEYKPNSALGINCWSGEHLNFVSTQEIEVQKGDEVIGRITKEPLEFLGSWKIEYEVLKIIKKEKIIKEDENIKKEEKEVKNEEKIIKINLSVYINKNYLEVVDELKETGFTNVITEKKETKDEKNADKTVNEILVDNKEITKNDTEFNKNSEIKVIFWELTELTPEELIKPPKGSKLEKDYETESKNDIYYINIEGIKNVPTIKKWGKATITDGVYEYFEYLEKHGFKIKVTKSKSREPYSGFWYYESEFTATKDGKTWKLYCDIQDEKYVEYEFRIEKNKTEQ